MKKICALALGALLAGTVVAAPMRHAAEPFLGTDIEARIEAAAQAMVSDGRTAGVAVGVVRGGQLVFNRSYGVANLELNEPVNASTVFRLASVTKQFTAASVLLLVEQHKLSLDDKLAKYYPDFPRGEQVTIRQLLNHTSGIRDYAEVLSEELGRTRPTGPQFVQRIAGLGYDFDPGTMWNYSNSGYFLLGQIIEKVSGASFADFTRANLFDRLGMMQTAVDDETQVVPFRASGYSSCEGCALGIRQRAVHLDGGGVCGRRHAFDRRRPGEMERRSVWRQGDVCRIVQHHDCACAPQERQAREGRRSTRRPVRQPAPTIRRSDRGSMGWVCTSAVSTATG